MPAIKEGVGGREVGVTIIGHKTSGTLRNVLYLDGVNVSQYLGCDDVLNKAS